MSINRERLVTITACYYYTEPMIINVPAHFSHDETREAIHSAVSKHPTQSQALSSAITPSGELVLVPHSSVLTWPYISFQGLSAVRGEYSHWGNHF